jgi:hypothetical protein
MHSCLSQSSLACRTTALSSTRSSSMQRAAAMVQQHAGVLLHPSRRVHAAAAVCRTYRLQACRHAQLQLHPATQYTAQAAISNSSSSSRGTTAGVLNVKRSAARVRCYSTANPAAGQTGPGSISWLCEVQAWPSQAAHEQTASSNGDAGASNPSSNGSAIGSTNGNGAAGSNRQGLNHEVAVTSSSSIISTEKDFAVLQAADLASMQFDAIVVLAGGLQPDGGLPVWAERRLDVGRDLHMMLGRKPPILCSGEMAGLPIVFKQLQHPRTEPVVWCAVCKGNLYEAGFRCPTLHSRSLVSSLVGLVLWVGCHCCAGRDKSVPSSSVGVAKGSAAVEVAGAAACSYIQFITAKDAEI